MYFSPERCVLKKCVTASKIVSDHLERARQALDSAGEVILAKRDELAAAEGLSVRELPSVLRELEQETEKACRDQLGKDVRGNAAPQETR